ncbi:MAG: cytochrome bd-type quinol oxidase subunit 1 [Flavobacterium sp.]|jgi:cytochrome bd-type quinol oxidase subunit 1
MFSIGQWIFAAFFVVVFVIAMVISYRKDKPLHEKFYKGNYKILLGFILFIAFLFLIKLTTKH